MIVVEIQGIRRTDEEAALWPKPHELCPICGNPFGREKMVKDVINGERVAVHRACSDGSFLRK